MKIEHIALYVNDLEKARDFFVTYFDAVSNDGYHNPRTDFRSYFLTFGDGSRLEIMTKPDLTDSGDFLNRFGYAHIAFSVGSKEAVDALTARLKDDGYPVFYAILKHGVDYDPGKLRADMIRPELEAA